MSDIEKRLKKHVEFCSWVIKYKMLNAAFIDKSVDKSVIDLCCGRGNDLNRWALLGINKVVGVDISSQQITEAIKRYKYAKHDIKNSVKVTYINMSVCDENLYNNIKRHLRCNFNVVTCNFSLNYFIHEDIFFQNLKNITKKGDVFIGTCADGEYIKSITQDTPVDQIKSEVVSVVPIDDLKYQFMLKTAYFDNNYVTEYYVTRLNLVTNMKKYGFESINIFNELPPIFNFSEFPDNTGDSELKKYFMGFSFVRV